jgi:N-acetylglucosamine-6-phosphate deacetylase
VAEAAAGPPDRPALRSVAGRLVLADGIVPGRLAIEDGWIAAVIEDPSDREAAAGPLVAPGFIDVHVHGWGGHDATGDADALSGMARALLRRGVTSFLPTAPTLPEAEVPRFADRVRRWMPGAPADGAEPLGFNLEGPFLAPARRGAHEATLLRTPAELPAEVLEAALDGLRITTIAPELEGSLALIERLAAMGIRVSIGHSGATLEEARAGYAAGGRTTTHLFNGMTGIDHRLPGLAVAALTTDAAYVELIADGNHVHPALWSIVARTKPADRLVLVSDALPIAGQVEGRGRIGALEVEVRDGRATLAGTGTLAGSVIALDTAVRNLVREGRPLPDAVRAASTNPAALLGAADRGAIAPGRRAHLVELTDDLYVRRVTRGAGWLAGAGR